MANQTIRIALGVITHRRPDGLLRLLQSFAEMKVPAGVSCTVLIAENDDAPMMTAHLDTIRAAVPFDVQLSFEGERGIPFARNHVLDMAIAGGFDFLTFVDDDQIVHEDWLVMLYATVAGRGLDLVGGPRNFIAEEGAVLSREAEAVLRHWQRAGAGLQNQRQRRALSDEEGAIPIYTNNWMLRLSKQQELGIKFDEGLRYTGGSDTKFYKDFATAGGKTGWSSDARALEIWPVKRLTLGYLYRRRCDQTTMQLIRNDKIPNRAVAYLRVYRASIFFVLYMLQVPFKGLRPVAAAFDKFGRAMGYVAAAAGKTSGLYTPQPGNQPIADAKLQER